MHDKKLTDSEIVKEFQLRTLKAEHPGFILCGQIVDLINRLQADCENYKQIAEHQQSVTMDRGFDIRRLKEKIESLQAENERLRKDLRNNRKGYDRLIEELANVKTKAYKEFADKVENEIDCQPHSKGMQESAERYRIKRIVNSVLKELVGEDK